MSLPREEMVALARDVLGRAYAPYSRFRVGAVLRGMNGKLYAGCHVEHAAYPLGTCAEAAAIAMMVGFTVFSYKAWRIQEILQATLSLILIVIVFNREDYAIIDNWDMVGMQGTGSKRVVIEDVFVPAYRAIRWTNANGELAIERPGRGLRSAARRASSVHRRPVRRLRRRPRPPCGAHP